MSETPLTSTEKLKENSRKVRQQTNRDKWRKERAPRTHTKDDVINAYLQGIKDGLSSIEKALLEKLVGHVKLIAEDRDKIASFLKEKGFSPDIAFLNIRAWNNFKLLIDVPKEDFLNDRFLDVYDVTDSIEDERRAQDIFLDIGFLSDCSTDSARNKLESDGFYHSWTF